uniref:Radical SAM/SPASM domain-containing protein n=1 Tax=Desulfacinum infernum TaxID=35837 RepID=A0A831ZT90_9BACT
MSDAKPLTPDYPHEVIVEVTNACNLRCRYCHFHGDAAPRTRPLGHMDPAVWHSVLEDLARWEKPVTLLTHGAGEPLLSPHLPELLKCAKQIPHLRVGFMTNAMLLDSAWTERLLDLRVDFLALSIDGVDPETHDAVRQNARLNIIERHVRHLIRRKAERQSATPALSFNMVLYPHIEDQGPAFVERWMPYAETITLSRFRPIGERTLWPSHANPPFRPCSLLWHQCVIAWDGRVGLCCEDIHLDVPTGSVLNQPLLQIFRHSPVFNAYRRHHLERRVEGLALCARCHIWGGDMVLQEWRETLAGCSVRVTQTPAYRMYRKEEALS